MSLTQIVLSLMLLLLYLGRVHPTLRSQSVHGVFRTRHCTTAMYVRHRAEMEILVLSIL